MKTEQSMKTLSLAVIVSCVTALSALAGTKMIYSTGGGESFDLTGVIVGYEGGDCIPQKFTYEFQSVDKRTEIWLCAVGSNEAALRRAMITHGLYRITGTWQRGVERPYVEVTSVRWD